MSVIMFIGADEAGMGKEGICLTSSNPGPSIVMGCEFDMDCDAGTECCEGGRG